MTDYTKLVKALRDIEKTMFALGTSPINMGDVSISLAYDKRWGQTAERAAAAIEALQAQLPKRGEWIVHTEVKNIYGGICIECPVCRDHFVVLNVSDEKYCRSCGAKMEVQE